MTRAVTAGGVGGVIALRREPVLRSRAAKGDARAFAALYERHHQALYRYCRSILQHDEDARDAVQSAMTLAFAALRDEQRDFELRPWLFRIAHNEAISILRRRRPTEQLDRASGLCGDELAQHVQHRERLAHLRVDLGDLPERQRAALVLRELSGLSHDEIALVLDCSPRSVKQTIFEARTALSECAEGRAMSCDAPLRTLSDADRRVLRGRRVRSHLRSCRSCRAFELALGQRPADLAALAPPLPVAAGAALLSQLLAGAQAGAGAAGITGTKAVAVIAVSAAMAGGAGTATQVIRDGGSAASEAPVVQRSGAPARAAARGAATPAAAGARVSAGASGSPQSGGASGRGRTGRRRWDPGGAGASTGEPSGRDALAAPGAGSNGRGPAGVPGEASGGRGPAGAPGAASNGRRPAGTPSGSSASGVRKPARAPGAASNRQRPAGTPSGSSASGVRKPARAPSAGTASGARKPSRAPTGSAPAAKPGRPAARGGPAATGSYGPAQRPAAGANAQAAPAGDATRPAPATASPPADPAAPRAASAAPFAQPVRDGGPK